LSIQIKQVFPHCERCGKMVHTKRARIVARADSRLVIFCSELCRDEYEGLFGLSDRGRWVDQTPEAVGAQGGGE
jgi:ribosomal protein L24E